MGSSLKKVGSHYSKYMYICIFLACAVTDIDGKLKHGKSIPQQSFPKIHIGFLLFFVSVGKSKSISTHMTRYSLSLFTLLFLDKRFSGVSHWSTCIMRLWFGLRPPLAGFVYERWWHQTAESPAIELLRLLAKSPPCHVMQKRGIPVRPHKGGKAPWCRLPDSRHCIGCGGGCPRSAATHLPPIQCHYGSKNGVAVVQQIVGGMPFLSRVNSSTFWNKDFQ